MQDTGTFGGGVSGQLKDWADRSLPVSVKSSIGSPHPATIMMNFDTINFKVIMSYFLTFIYFKIPQKLSALVDIFTLL